MNIIENPLAVPPAILALNDVTASEKMLLAVYVADRDAKNFRALHIVGVGLSGLKKIKRRLIAKGYLRGTANGYEVLVPGLMPAPEDEEGHFVSNSGGVENTNKVAPPPALKKERSLVQQLEDHEKFYQQVAHSSEVYTASLEMLSQNFLDFVTNEVPKDTPGIDKLLAILTARRDYWFAASFISDNFPGDSRRKFAKLIGRATPNQLATLRTAIAQAKLTGGKPTLLLQQLSSEGQ
jgi:hypothetical protein